MESKWIAHKLDNNEDIALICFPHAGGTASFFAKWGNYFKGNAAILPVQYPMREKRIRDVMPNSVIELAKQFVDENIELLKNRKFAFFGHCSGSIVAYEACKYAEEKYNVKPLVLIASACMSPKNFNVPILSDLDEKSLIQKIKDYGYIPDELLNNEMMFQYFLPIVRKDFHIQEQYKCTNEVKIDSKIVTMYGIEDSNINDIEKIKDWERYTSKDYVFTSFKGNHFYLENDLDLVSKEIIKQIRGE